MKLISKSLKNIIRVPEYFYNHPFYIFVEILCLLLTGLMGSLFTNEIRTLEHYSFGFNSKFVFWPVGFFWIIFLFTITISVCRHYKTQKDQEKLTNELKDLIKTQPDSQILEKISTYFEIKYQEMLSELSDPTIKGIEETIRSILLALCDIADKSNPYHTADYYGANIMIFIDMEEIKRSSSYSEIVNEAESFMDVNGSLESRKGVLRLAIQLSCDKSSEESENTFNKRIKPISLPVPIIQSILKTEFTDEDDIHWFVLPGGPSAFEKNNPEAIPDTTKIGQICREYGSFEPSVIEKIENYMRESAKNKRFCSFISIPIPKSPINLDENPSEISSMPSYVLNIESNKKGFFEDANPFLKFCLTTKPFIYMLSQLLEQLHQLEPNYGLRSYLSSEGAEE